MLQAIAILIDRWLRMGQCWQPSRPGKPPADAVLVDLALPAERSAPAVANPNVLVNTFVQ